MSNYAEKSAFHPGYNFPTGEEQESLVDTNESTGEGYERAKEQDGKVSHAPVSASKLIVQPIVTFEQAHQQVGWQYNAGRDINIINVQSRGELADELTKMQEQVKEGSEHEVISAEIAAHLQEQLKTINEQLRSDQRQDDAILKELQKTRAYLQAESDKLAQQIPQKRNDSGFFRLLVGVATLGTIAFDLGLTAAIVTGLFGLAAKQS